MPTLATRHPVTLSGRPAAALLVLFMALIGQVPGVRAHDAGNLNDASVNRTNDAVAEAVLELQGVLTGFIRGSRDGKDWPGPELQRLQSELDHLAEDAALSLEYLLNDGVNLRDGNALRQRPVAGRAVAANRAIETGLALIEHVGSLPSRDDFVREIYDRGLAYYMYDLLGAYRDKLDLYAALSHEGA